MSDIEEYTQDQYKNFKPRSLNCQHRSILGDNGIFIGNMETIQKIYNQMKTEDAFHTRSC